MKMPKGRREFTHCRNKLLQEKKFSGENSEHQNFSVSLTD